MRLWRAAAVLAALVLLTGCSAFVDGDQLTVAPGKAAHLAAGRRVGQTFSAQHAGLNGVEIWLAPEQPGSGEVRTHLRAGSQSTDDLATTALPLSQVTAPAYYRFVFSTLPDSHGRDFYIEVEMSGSGQVAVGTGHDAAYLNGALYQDGQPQNVQMTFRLVYDRPAMLLDQAMAGVSTLPLLGLAALLFVLPGWALLAWLWRGSPLSWGEILAISVGVSLALYPLLLLWTDVAGWHLGPWNAWLPVIAAVAALAWRYAPACLRQCRIGLRGMVLRRSARNLGPDLALIVAFGLIFSARLLVIRGLETPSWGDSVQHVAITQLLLDHGGLFTSWQPYAPYGTLTVHYGFSAFAALLGWAGGFDGNQATLLAGQIINALAALTLYPLAMRISRGKRWAGTGAVLVAGLLSPMPAYYVNWGRFAQMAGHAILPVALWLLCEALEAERFNWRAVALAGLAAAGMTLTYLRMPWYYACFVLAWLICYGVPHWRLQASQWLKRGLWLAAIGAVIVVLIYPWRSRLGGSNLETGLAMGMTAGGASERVLAAVLADYRTWKGVAEYLPRGLQALALVALGWSVARRNWTATAIGLWAALLASLVAGQLIHLPGSNMIQGFAVMIALYIPASLLIGWLLGDIVQEAGRIRYHPAPWATACAVLLLAGWGGARQMSVVQPQFVMVTRPDMRAMNWIRGNTPSDARFLVEGFRVYEGASAVGADAGWYIPLLAGRANTMAPQYAMLSEQPIEKGYTQAMVDLVAQLENTSPASAQGLRLLCERGITHVYVGQGQGKVGLPARQLFAPDSLANSPDFQEIYHQDQVRIFRLAPGACAGSRS